MSYLDDFYWINLAHFYAKYAASQGEIPVGAVIVQNDHFISAGWNQSIIKNDPTAHAEIVAIRLAAQQLNNYRLIDCDLYITLEPCMMCAGAIIHSRFRRVIYGASDYKTGAAGSVFSLLPHHNNNHQLQVLSNIESTKCGQLLSDFFKKRRQEKKQKKLRLNKIIS